MRLRALGAYGAELFGFRSSAFQIDGKYIIDCGNIELLDKKDMEEIRCVFLSHAHLDHIKAIPFLAETMAEMGKTLYVVCPEKVISSLRDHIFNGHIWPDLTKIPSPLKPALKFIECHENTPRKIDDLLVEFVPVNHTVPSYGIILSHRDISLVYSSDTGPTELLWEHVTHVQNLSAIMIEVSYPDRMEDKAIKNGHLTPLLAAREIEKVSPSPDTKIFAYHLKPPYIEEIIKELNNMHKNFIIMKDKDTWEL